MGKWDVLIPYERQAAYLPKKRRRIWEIDFVRGICVLLMILDHFSMLIYQEFAPIWYHRDLEIYDAFSLFCHNWNVLDARPIIHEIVLFVFFSISGISCILSRSNRKRGCQLAVIALAYSLCSIFAEKVLQIGDISVTFGVLNFLATAMLLYAFVAFVCKGDRWQICIWSVGIIAITVILYFYCFPPATAPKFLQTIFPPYDFFGQHNPLFDQGNISPGDLFSLVPYLAYYFAGVILGALFYRNRQSKLPKLDGKWNVPINFLGRHALIFYVVHVVFLTLLLGVVTYFVTGEFLL